MSTIEPLEAAKRAPGYSAPTHNIETWVGYMLRYGVLLAAMVVLIGGALYLKQAMRHGLPDYAHFRAGAVKLRTFGEIASHLRAHDPNAVIQVGLLLLILTPVARVAMCMVGFALEKNRLYVAVSSTVMAVLIYSLMHGR